MLFRGVEVPRELNVWGKDASRGAALAGRVLGSERGRDRRGGLGAREDGDNGGERKEPGARNKNDAPQRYVA